MEILYKRKNFAEEVPSRVWLKRLRDVPDVYRPNERGSRNSKCLTLLLRQQFGNATKDQEQLNSI